MGFLSQVFLSFGITFALIPLVAFRHNPTLMAKTPSRVCSQTTRDTSRSPPRDRRLENRQGRQL